MNKVTEERIAVNILKYTLGLPVLVVLTIMSALGACGILFIATLVSFLGKVTNTTPDKYDSHKERMDDFKSFWDAGFEMWKPWKKQAPEDSLVHFETLGDILSEIRDNTSKDDD